MNISIYILFLIVSFAFILLGYAQRGEADVFKYVGFGFLFLLGVLLIPGTPGNLEYKTGSIEVYENATTTTTISYSYENYSSFIYGFYISLLAIFGFIQTLITRREEDFGK